jgi:hypothetical protein
MMNGTRVQGMLSLLEKTEMQVSVSIITLQSVRGELVEP